MVTFTITSTIAIITISICSISQRVERFGVRAIRVDAKLIQDSSQWLIRGDHILCMMESMCVQVAQHSFKNDLMYLIGSEFPHKIGLILSTCDSF